MPCRSSDCRWNDRGGAGRFFALLAISAVIAAFAGCGDDDPSRPDGAMKTENLEAEKVSAPPDAAFWNSADFIEFTASSTAGNGSIGQSYSGEFNMTGSKTGFDVTVQMKAAYTSTDLYIWTQWRDHSMTNDLNRRRWFFNGGASNSVPFFPAGVTDQSIAESTPPGWSSNQNDDKIGVMWDILQGGVGASAADGSKFKDVGCAMTCHTPADMYPINGRTDLWHWKTSRSNPVGYANDQYCVNDPATPGRKTDAGETIELRNRPTGGNNFSGPAFVWDPTKLNRIVRASDGAIFDLDPKLALANSARMAIEGDAAAGNSIYQAKCQTCHNADGRGASKDLAIYGLEKTRDQIVNKLNANGVTHGGGNTQVTDATDQGNLVARIRAFAGVPGYTLQDVTAPGDAVFVTNAKTVYSEGSYTVIFRRKLTTSKPTEDAQFTDVSSEAEYPFSVAIMDNDGKNHAGSPLLKLVFRQ
jgi:mono/diheme cytochrome c family protein